MLQTPRGTHLDTVAKGQCACVERRDAYILAASLITQISVLKHLIAGEPDDDDIKVTCSGILWYNSTCLVTCWHPLRTPEQMELSRYDLSEREKQ